MSNQGIKRNTNVSVFNNPAIEKIKQNMSQEELDKYEKYGEEMYGNMDMDMNMNMDMNNNSLEDGAYKHCCKLLLAGLKSGLEIDELTEEEINVIEKIHGKDWKNKLGFIY
jgi:hypothetical protein